MTDKFSPCPQWLKALYGWTGYWPLVNQIYTRPPINVFAIPAIFNIEMTHVTETFPRGIQGPTHHSWLTPWTLLASSNSNIFHVTGPRCGELTSHRWIPLTKVSDTELWCFLWAWTNVCANNQNADDLRRHRANHDVTVMIKFTIYHEYSGYILCHKVHFELVKWTQLKLEHG